MRRFASIFPVLCAAVLFAPALARAMNVYEMESSSSFNWLDPWHHVITCVFSALLGALLGAFFSDRFRRFRQILALCILSLVLLLGLRQPGLGQILSFIGGFILAYSLLSDKTRQTFIRRVLGGFKKFRQTVFGSSGWADAAYIVANDLTGEDGLFLGLFRHLDADGTVQEMPLRYKGDRHLLTVAPARMGKGVSAVIPNLLSYQGSVLVIDPKGENAMITAARRGQGDPRRAIPGMGQEVHIVDPWRIVTQTPACFNPLDWLDPNDEDINENAMILWDGIVVSRASNEPFWDDEARALGVGLTLHVATAESERGNRHLGRVRDIIVSGAAEFDLVLNDMLASANRVVQSTAMRTASKDQKLLSNVLASLQAHTHFLDSPRMRESLSRSDFRFEDLKTRKMTVYLVLPADRLDTFGRWLRLMVQQALTVNARNIDKKPDKPILFMLDEMAALGRLTMVEQAYGLMAGYGMQLWGIVQDISQLERNYDKGWETFIGNSGVLQYFGSRDLKSAEYFSKLAGMTTAEKFSWSRTIGRSLNRTHTSGTSQGSSSSHGDSGLSWGRNQGSSIGESEGVSLSDGESENRDVTQRPLIMPDELMVMRRNESLLIVDNLNPVKAFKIRWFEHIRFKLLGVNLQPAQPEEKQEDEEESKG
ncbi:MAG: type IV secretory system conjugative DNA transfer family protein [Rhodospirillales bacterium]|nr:type IV secretory system conjugative DNA transfer family protein [Rhodospirillales bacterium]